MKLFQFDYEQQTKRFKDLAGQGKYNPSLQNRQPPKNDFSINGNDVTGADYDENDELDKSEAGLAKIGDSMEFVEKNNFDVNLLVAERKL